MYQNKQVLALGSVVFLFFAIAGLIVMSLWVWPKYNLYRMEMHGMAALKEAEWSKQILIAEARARETASSMQAKARVTLAEAEGKAQVVSAKSEGLADIERAKAAGESNKIIGESLKGNEEYLLDIYG